MAQTLKEIVGQLSGESFDAAVNNPYDYMVVLITAENNATQAIRQAVEEIIGADEKHFVVDNGVAIDSCDSYKTANEADCNCPAGERNQLRKEQRANLMKFIEGAKV